MTISKPFLSLAAAGVLLTGCADYNPSFETKSVEEIYNTAMDFMDKQSYVKAAKVFAEVERQFPYSPWAVKGQLMSAYAYYEAGKYEEALESFHVFTQLHPGHDEVPYALYMMGLCHYEQILIIQRDQDNAQKSREHFDEVVNRFPSSKYARDAALKLDLIHDHMAAKEMDVGRFYLEKRSYLGAINRFQTVVKHYDKTTHVQEALYRLVESYLSLGIHEQAKASAAILGHNYPESIWYKDAYSLLSKMDLTPA